MRGDRYVVTDDGLEFHSGEDNTVTLLKTKQELFWERLRAHYAKDK